MKDQDTGEIDSSEKLLEIVFDQINSKFEDKFLVYVAIWKQIVKDNKYISDDFKATVKSVFDAKKKYLIE